MPEELKQLFGIATDRKDEMNSPAVTISAPSPQPALELIALAQLSPEIARQKLRARLLTNPNYFEKIPATSFGAVLNIQQDTTYESISRLVYDTEIDQLSAAIDVKQPTGYSSEIMVRGSEEFVRFYLSSDGGLKWHDLGMRSVTVCDSFRRLGNPEYQVSLNLAARVETARNTIQPRIRAILSWSTPPPAGQPGWTPVWGHVAESDIPLEDSLTVDGKRTVGPASVDRLDVAPDRMYVYQPMDFTSARAHGHLSMRALHSTKTDPHHRFLAFVLARAAGYCSSNSSNSRTGESQWIQTMVPPPERSVSVTAGIS